MFDNNITSTLKLYETNSTTSLNGPKYFLLSIILPNLVVSSFLALTLWITISLVHYGIKTGKWRQLKKQNRADKLNIGHIYSSTLLCGVMVIFYDVVGLIYMNTGFATDDYTPESLHEYCDLLSDLAFSAYVSTLVSTTLFLWLRQRIFFQNRLLNVNYNKCVKVLSPLSLFVILALAIGVLIFNILPDNHRASTDGCVDNPNTKRGIGYWISMTTVIVFYQSLFLGLFVYAIKSTRISSKSDDSDQSKKSCSKPCQKRVSHGNLQKSNSNDLTVSTFYLDQAGHSVVKPSVDASGFSRQQSAWAGKVRSAMIKTFAAAVMTTLLDIFEVLLINFIVKPFEHHRYVVMFTSFNLFLHLFMIVFAYAKCSKMLTTLCRRRQS